MTLLELHVVDTIEAIADNTPLHADELRKCANRVKSMCDELDFCRRQLRDAALLMQSQRDEIERLRDTSGPLYETMESMPFLKDD